MAEGMSRPGLYTTIELPPPPQLVSPVTPASAAIGSPTPTPGEMRYNFWDPANTTNNLLQKLKGTPRGTPRGTPVVSPAETINGGEKKVIFWEPVSKDANTSNTGALRHSGVGSHIGSRVTSPVRSPGEKSSIWEAPRWELGKAAEGFLSPRFRRPSTSHGTDKNGTKKEKKKHMWGMGPKMKTSMSNLKPGGHKVTFSDASTGSDGSHGSKTSSSEHESSQSDTSRPGSPAKSAMKKPTPVRRTPSEEKLAMSQARARIIQLVDKRAVAIALETPAITAPRKPPFVAYTETFLQILGVNPIFEQVLHDPRGSYFSGSGAFHRPTSTLFITSSFLKDPAPSAAPSRNYAVTATSLAFYDDNDITRDKVRFSENHMPGGICIWHPSLISSPTNRTFPSKASQPQQSVAPATSLSTSPPSSLIICAQGTLNNPSGLLQVAARRPHTVTPLLTTYTGGRPFNSPHSCVALSDGSILFTDPPVGYEIGFRSRPQLPPFIYRFDPSTGDIRAIADTLARPTALAVSPDERNLYVIDAPRPARIPGKGTYVEDVLDACTAAQPTVQAYSLVGVGTGGMGLASAQGVGGSGGVFLINKRLFAFPERCPNGIAVSARGDVFLACGSVGLMVYGRDGSLAGRVRVGQGESVQGVCTGRKGELFCWGGGRVWRVEIEASRMI